MRFRVYNIAIVADIARAFLSIGLSEPVQIHAFSDASFDALGTVVFVKQCEKVSIVGSKGKVVGHKAKQSATIPQLELSAMTLCAKYVNSVVNVLSILIVQSRK
jgi:hypothetical protein